MGLSFMPCVRILERPRDRANLRRYGGNLWATACETALWPAGTFARAYAANRTAARESIIEADPLATCVRAIIVNRTIWTGSVSDLLRLFAEGARDAIFEGGPEWPKIRGRSPIDCGGRRRSSGRWVSR